MRPDAVSSVNPETGVIDIDTDTADSTEITLDAWQRHPWMLRALAWLSRFLRYWL